jgi:hypothetical protein
VATTEYWYHELGPCTCGQGEIKESVVSPDHPRGGGSCTTFIACDCCRGEWRIQGRHLIQVACEEAKPLAEEQSKPHRELNGTGQVAVNDCCSARCKTRKAEWEEVTPLGMFSASQATYLKRRRELPTVGAIVQGHVELDWIVANAPSEPQQVRAQEISQAAEVEASLRATGGRNGAGVTLPYSAFQLYACHPRP